MNIRSATEGDFSAMAEIYNQYIGVSTMDLKTKTASYFEDLMLKQDDSEGLFVVESPSQILGWGILKKYSNREGYAKAAETSVYIDSDHRAKGCGRAMKAHLMAEAKRKGYKHLVAKIWANNQTSIQYNLKFGYSIVGTQNQIGFVNGEWIDVVIMQYVFED